MSSDLTWILLKQTNNSFLVRKGCKKAFPTFSTEPTNLKNIHSFKYSGLVNKKAISVQAAENGRGVTLALKNTKAAQNPAKLFTKIPLQKGGVRRCAKSIKNIVGSSFYRRDLKNLALARTSQIIKSQKVKAK